MGRTADLIHKEYEKKVLEMPYTFCHYKKFNYRKLSYIWDIKSAGLGDLSSYNDVIIMADTETSKKKLDVWNDKEKQWSTDQNHVVAWTISIRAYHKTICTLYVRKPS